MIGLLVLMALQSWTSSGRVQAGMQMQAASIVATPVKVAIECDLVVTKFTSNANGTYTSVPVWTDPFTGIASPTTGHLKMRAGGVKLAQWVYTESDWFANGGPVTTGTPSVIYLSYNAPAGTVTMASFTRYLGASDLAEVLVNRNADGSYAVTFQILPSGSPTPYFAGKATVPSTAVTWF